MSPENTMTFRRPPSSTVTSRLADPRMCPASTARTLMPGATSVAWSYRRRRNSECSAVHFLLRVERLDERLAFFRTPAVLTLGVLGLQVRRILEDQLRERNRRRRGEDRPSVAEPRQERKSAGVIEMRVGEDDCLQLLHRGRRRQPIGVLELLRALKEPAVDHDVCGGGLKKCTRSRDFVIPLLMPRGDETGSVRRPGRWSPQSK